jgi:multidrug efflux pump subunit AcrA (membrane-fusion protein)
VGQEVLVRPTSGSGKAAAGAVRYIDDSIDAANRTLSILVDVANPEQQFLLGAYVKMDFPLSRRKALAVPEEAVVDDGTTQRVYVAREQETFEPLAVQLGAKQDGWWQVVSGLEEGSLVVSKGAALLGSLPRPESEEASGVATSLDSRPSSDLIPAAR